MDDRRVSCSVALHRERLVLPGPFATDAGPDRVGPGSCEPLPAPAGLGRIRRDGVCGRTVIRRRSAEPGPSVEPKTGQHAVDPDRPAAVDQARVQHRSHDTPRFGFRYPHRDVAARRFLNLTTRSAASHDTASPAPGRAAAPRSFAAVRTRACRAEFATLP